MFDVDEGPRRDTSLEALAKLRPAFHVSGTVTAGNSSQMSDGAAVVLVTSDKFARERRLQPLARFVAFATAGVAPERFGTGPVPAIHKVLKLAGLSLNDIDVIELNEAFAAQVLACLRELPMDEARLNVNGGAIALGHPLGCTGAKLTTSLLHEISKRKAQYRLCPCAWAAAWVPPASWKGSDVPSHGRHRRRLAARSGDPSGVLTPESLSEEHQMIGADRPGVRDQARVLPGIDRLEQKDWGFARQLLRRAGELGLLGVDAPEEFGGVGLDKAASLVVSRVLVRQRLLQRRVWRPNQPGYRADSAVSAQLIKKLATCRS